MKHSQLSLFLCTAVIYASAAVAQPAIVKQMVAGGRLDDKLTGMYLTSDGGFVAGGYSFSNISGDKTENRRGSNDYWIVKFNNSGKIQWDKTIGGNKDDELYAIQQTDDGGYILGGWSVSDKSGEKRENSRGGYDYWVVKLDPSGNIQWDKTIGGRETDQLSALQQTRDGGYILGGSSFSNRSGEKKENSRGVFDYWLVKLDATGNIKWDKTIGGDNLDNLTCLQQTSDGGYIVGGWSVSNASGEKSEGSKGFQDYWVVKLNPQGEIVWDKTIGGFQLDELYALQQSADGGYILGGSSGSFTGGVRDYWIVKLDASGNTRWNKNIGGNDNDYLRSIQQTRDGGYIMGGYSYSAISRDKTEKNRGYADYWIVKVNSHGAIQWDKTIGGNSEDFLMSIKEMEKNLYIAGGYSFSGISGDKTKKSRGANDYWIAELSDKKNLRSVEEASQNVYSTVIPNTSKNRFAIYPNPAKDILFIQLNGKATISLNDQAGKVLFTKAIQGSSIINVADVPVGSYYLKNSTTNITHKIIIAR